MKQAIVITAYKNLDFLDEIIKTFDDNFTFYIHLDNKKKYSRDKISHLQANHKIKLLSLRYGVNWGSITHLQAILYLYEEALKDQNVEYIHLITGQDYPIKSSKQITDFLKKNRGTEFIVGEPLPSSSWKKGGLNRISYYLPYEYFNARKFSGRIIIKTGLFFQKLFGFKRSLPSQFDTIYGGTVYSTLTRQAVEYIINYLNADPAIFDRFRKTFCAEEILIQTILMNSNSPFKNRISQNNLRFIIWEYRNGKTPADLDDRDYDAICRSDAFFARKFEFPVSSGLLHKLQKPPLK